MRIGIDLLPLQTETAGVERYARSLIREWARLDRENQYFLFLTEGNREAFEPSRADNFHSIVYSIPAHLRPWRISWEQAVLPLAARHLGLDLLFCPSNIAPLLTPCHLVVTVHDLHWFFFPELFSRVKWWYVTHFISLSARKADRVITDSQNSKQDIARLIKLPAEKIKVVYPGLGPPFRPLKEVEGQAARVRRRYNIENKFILTVERLYRRKNIPRLLRAYHALKERENLPAQLVIVGAKGDGYEEIISTIEELKLKQDVVLTGPVSDEELIALYNMASLFVYPSLYEGFGIPVLEAMACGVPVVASNASSLPEVCGDAALTVDPYDTEALAGAIWKLWQDESLRRDMGRKGRERAGNFTWEKAARETLTIFEEVCEVK
ncbi:MAG: glycosyltransferase family 4 protein [Anaerolineae bacterium]